MSASATDLRLAIVASHPIQYQAPLFRELARRLNLEVFFAIDPTARDQAEAGFGTAFRWDVDLLSGYSHCFLKNNAAEPSISFRGCDTPEIRSILRRERYDCVLVLGWYLKSFVQAIWAAKRGRIPLMVRGDNHLLEPRSRLREAAKRIVYPFGLRAFDAALYVGQRSHEYFRHYGMPEEKLFFVPHSVDEMHFESAASDEGRLREREKFGIDDGEFVALFVGKLIARKRVEDLLAAAALLRGTGRDVTVVIAGSGPLEDELRTRADALQVKVRFLGFQNQAALPGIYAACDALVLPSDNESWGLVANEALVSGRPVIVSDVVGCAPDLAADRTAGRVFRTRDPADLARAMSEMIDAPPSRAAIAAKSRAYDTATAAAGIVDACASVVGRR